MGETKSSETKLIVLPQTLIPSKCGTELADILGMNLNEHGTDKDREVGLSMDLSLCSCANRVSLSLGTHSSG